MENKQGKEPEKNPETELHVKESLNGEEVRIKLTPDETGDPVKKFNEDIWMTVMALIKKLQDNPDPHNNLAVFIALKAPDITCSDHDGNPANALGFSSGKMIKVAGMMNEIMAQHTELTAAMDFEKRIRNISGIMEAIAKIDELIKSKPANDLKV